MQTLEKSFIRPRLWPVFGAALGLLSLVSVGLAQTASSPRQTVNFDAGWRFLKGDAPGAEKAGFNDGAWTVLNVPHDWSIEGPYAEKAPSGASGGFLPTGVSWYRKSFTPPPGGGERKVFIEFDGVMANSEVWLNGRSLGKRPNGYISFRYDLTPYLEQGKPNVLSVKTDTTRQPDSRWYTGQGIYRHVRLVAADPVHIPQWGVCVRTPRITDAQATVQVTTTVANTSSSAREVAVQTVLTGPGGKESARGNSAVQKIEPGKSAEFTQELIVAQPTLWSLETPSLYQAAVSVVADKTRVLDQTAQPFGIRSCEFKADTGFWINGKNVKIKGVCLHHDGGAVGTAVPLRVWERRLETLRSLGVNAVRTSHNPPAPEFLDLCDRMGFLIMLETFDNWNWTAGSGRKQFCEWYIRDWWKRDARDIVLRDRNHPSIVIWSMGNEIPRPFGQAGTQSQHDALIAERDLIHQLDPTRPVTVALIAPDGRNQVPEFTDLMDVAGVNYRPLVLPVIAKDGKPVIATEETHELWKWAQYRDMPALSGCFLWTGIDYVGETGFGVNGWPWIISSNDRNVGFGLIDISGVVRPRGFQRQSWWAEKPMVSMARYARSGDGFEGTGPLLRDWTPDKPGDYKDAIVEVYSNADEVELFLNGKSLSARKVRPSGIPETWRLPYTPGTLKAVAKKGGQIVATDEWTTAGEPARIVLTTDRAKLANTFDDVAHLTATLVDAKGTVCPNSGNLLTFEVTGPGKVLGIANGDRASHRPFPESQREAWQGTCTGIVRATAPSGEMTVTVSAKGLPAATVKIQATAP